MPAAAGHHDDARSRKHRLRQPRQLPPRLLVAEALPAFIAAAAGVDRPVLPRWREVDHCPRGSWIMQNRARRHCAWGQRHGACLLAIGLLTRTATDGVPRWEASGEQEGLRRQAIEAITNGDQVTALRNFREVLLLNPNPKPPKTQVLNPKP